MSATVATRYVKPTKGDEMFSGLLAWLARRGVSVFGARLLTVAAQQSGIVPTTDFNVLEVEGRRYPGAPRGETSVFGTLLTDTEA